MHISGKRSRGPWRKLAVLLLIVAIGALGSVPAFATPPQGPSAAPLAEARPDCSWNCTANDIQPGNIFLGDADGNRLSLDECTGTQTAKLWVTFAGNPDRRGIRSWGDIYVGGALVGTLDGYCLETQSSGASVVLADVTFECSQAVEVRNLLIVWGVNSKATCGSPLVCNGGGYAPAQSYCAASLPLYIPPLTADIAFSLDNPCTGADVTFGGTASGGLPPYTYGWDFGDGGTATGQSVTHPYAQAGDYTVTLTVTDTAQLTATANATVTVVDCPEPLAAEIAFTPDNACPETVIAFDGTATGGVEPYNYEWDFGDGGSSTELDTTHTYAAPGTYPVTLTVTDTAQVVATASASVTVVDCTQPLGADFTFSPDGACPGTGITFDGTVTGGDGPYSFAWDFGDGGSSSDLDTTHAYTAPGTYTVTLTVTDGAQESDTVQHTLTVANCLAPDFTFSPDNECPGTDIAFTGSASGGAGPYTYDWNFGDSNTGTGQVVTHAYALPGTYTVSLTVTDADGESVTVEHTVTVANCLGPDFAFSPDNACPGTEIAFTGRASAGAGAYTYAWDFGDGSTGAGQAVTHTYAVPGAYAVKLTVTDADGESVTVEHTVTVANCLAPEFTFSPDNECPGTDIAFTGSASGGAGPYEYAWDFGDSNTGTGQDATHAYAAPGTYTVVLTVMDASEHTATATHSVTVASCQEGARFTKTADRSTAEVGDIIHYTLTFENTGEVSLGNVVISDAMLGINEAQSTLTPGASAIVTGTYGPVSEGDLPGPIVNTAIATWGEEGRLEASWAVALSEEPAPKPTPTPSPEPCTRSDVSVIINGGWAGIGVKAWVGGTEQPTQFTALDASGRPAALWTFHVPLGETWNVRVEPQLPPGLDPTRWEYRPTSGSVSIKPCSSQQIQFQLVDTGPTETVILPVTGAASHPAKLSLWQWLAKWVELRVNAWIG